MHGESLLQGPSVQTGQLEQEVWALLNGVAARWSAHITLQWVPGHVRLERQEESDIVAKRAARHRRSASLSRLAAPAGRKGGRALGIHRQRVGSRASGSTASFQTDPGRIQRWISPGSPHSRISK